MARINNLSETILEIAPNFCWVSAFDLFLMVEQVHEEVDYNSFKVRLCRLAKIGKILRKKNDRAPHERRRRGWPGFLYIKPTEEATP